MSIGDARTATEAGRLARLGFLDGSAAARLLAEPALDLVTRTEAGQEVLRAVADAADPDLALGQLSRLLESLGEQGGPAVEALVDALADGRFRSRLVAVLGTSVALGDHLARHPGDWRLVRSAAEGPELADAVRARLLAAVSGDDGCAESLRIAYRRELLAIAVRDLAGQQDVAAVAAELADLAAGTLDGALVLAAAEVREAGLDPDSCRLAVIGMGKCGGRELNYLSDVDVVFVAEPTANDGDATSEVAALRTAGRLASAMMRICSAATAEGTIWEVDAALRPEGKAGPLVRTLASHRAYYERWASTWEFQALLKARAVAGDLALGRTYVEAVLPFVWKAADRDNFVEDVQAMRRRVEGQLAGGDAERELKLGAGGLRDVEFAVQLLQLVHGRTDESLHSGSTLTALTALSHGGYVGREDAAALDTAYRFLRTLEHRVQIHRLRRTHVLPADPVQLRPLGRSLGFRRDPVGELERQWRMHAREVRRLHEKLFYRPLLNAVARLHGADARLTPEAARSRLVALGYADPAGALRHLEALTAGVSRRAAIQRTLLPVLLGWFADAPDPDAGLLGFRQVSDALGSTPWYLRMLRDEGAAAERMAHLLASSRYATELLLRAPDVVTMLAHDEELVPLSLSQLRGEALAAVRRSDDPTVAVAGVRGIRRRELLRICSADVLLGMDVEDVGSALTDVTAVTLQGGLEAAIRFVTAERREPLPTRFCIMAMGRLGGSEVGYASDADVLFVHDPLPGADDRLAHDAAHAVANELRRLLALPAADPPLPVDADLRPEGRQGPLVRTLASYAAYYRRWSSGWESQALLRAAPIAGDETLGEQFVQLVDPMRYPTGGISDAAVREIRRIKSRIEAERLPRGADPSLHTKLGRGGLSDVEWTVQLLQLQHAAQLPELRTARTLTALAAAERAGLLDAEDAQALAASWRFAARVRNATMLVTGRPSDAVPRDLRVMAGVGRLVGIGNGGSGALVDEYRRVTRRARLSVEKVFYGSSR